MGYVICVLVGMLAGIVLWEKIGVRDVYKGNFKFKQRGRHNRQDNKVDADMGLKKSRKERIADRRVDKQRNKV